MKGSKLLMVLAVLAVVVTLVTLVVTVNKFGITGRASDTGTANLTIAAAASISFTDNACDFGSGAVNEEPTFAIVYTGNTSTDNGTWTACDGLTMQNDGNVNLTVTVASDVVASAFIGGTSPSFKWIAADGSDCVGVEGLTTLTEVSGTPNVCTNLTQTGTIDLDFALVIPENAPPGSTGAVITATGTAVS